MKLNVQTNLTFFLERIILLGWVGSKEALRGLVAGGSDRVGSFQVRSIWIIENSH